MKAGGNTKEAVEARRAAWLTRLHAELNRMVALLRRHPGVRRVVLFGSLADGTAGAHSDLDLVIVMQDTGKRFMDRLDEVYRLLVPTVETDILVYTPEEWDELSTGRAFVKRIAERGVTLYEAVGG